MLWVPAMNSAELSAPPCRCPHPQMRRLLADLPQGCESPRRLWGVTASCKVLGKKKKHSKYHCHSFRKTLRLGSGPWKNISRERAWPEPAQSSGQHLTPQPCPADSPSRTVTELPSPVGSHRHSTSPHQVSTGPPSLSVLTLNLGSRWVRELLPS